MPGGLESVLLPQYLTDSRWARCAAIKDTSHVQVPVFGWSWNPNERFATAPGAHAFRRNVEYAHGGVSLQECMIPELLLTREEGGGVTATITTIKWAGLRCRIDVEASGPGLKAELRTKPADPASSIAGSKLIGEDGKVGLLVEDEELAGYAAFVVIIDAAGGVIVREHVTVGGEEK